MAGSNFDAQTDRAIADLQECALDPTLDQCCRRDIHEQIASARIRGQLRSVDRVDAALRARDRVILCDTLASEHPTTSTASQPQESTIDESDDDDAALAELRKRRLQQLQQDAHAAEERRRAGLGQLRDVPLTHLAGSIEEQAACVIHLSASGWPVCEHLDELLTTLAHQYQHTCFCRSPVPAALVKSSQTAPNGVTVGPLKITHGLPSLVVSKEGAIVGQAPVVRFGGAADLVEEEVVGYLRRLGALKSAASSSSSRVRGPGRHVSSCKSGDEDSWEEEKDEEEEQEEGGAPACEQCGRRYPHQHVRAAYSTPLQDSSDEEEGHGT